MIKILMEKVGNVQEEVGNILGEMESYKKK